MILTVMDAEQVRSSFFQFSQEQGHGKSLPGGFLCFSFCRSSTASQLFHYSASERVAHRVVCRDGDMRRGGVGGII